MTAGKVVFDKSTPNQIVLMPTGHRYTLSTRFISALAGEELVDGHTYFLSAVDTSESLFVHEAERVPVRNLWYEMATDPLLRPQCPVNLYTGTGADRKFFGTAFLINQGGVHIQSAKASEGYLCTQFGYMAENNINFAFPHALDIPGFFPECGKVPFTRAEMQERVYSLGMRTFSGAGDLLEQLRTLGPPSDVLQDLLYHERTTGNRIIVLYRMSIDALNWALSRGMWQLAPFIRRDEARKMVSDNTMPSWRFRAMGDLFRASTGEPG